MASIISGMSRSSSSTDVEAQASARKAKRRRIQNKPEGLDDTRISHLGPLLPPCCLLEQLPLTAPIAEVVHNGRAQVASIVNGLDDRLVCIVGPCSVHDIKAAKEYATELRKMQLKYKDDLCIIMRVYFEKPRTTIGWKGLINDPDLDGSFNVNKGLSIGRQLLLDINEMGIPCAVEFLDTISPQWLADLVSWGAIGARTTESQCHRELVSGLSMPVGFKNSTAGNFQIASDAIGSARNPHAFLSVTKQGLAAIVHTNGNPDCHCILRGGHSGPNYEPQYVKECTDILRKDGANPRIIVDCSHGNSRKIHTNQPIVAKSVSDQMSNGNNDIVGVMVESNLTAGKQKYTPGVSDFSKLAYGQSITDACVDVPSTDVLLSGLAEGVRTRRAMNRSGKGSMKADSLPIK